MWRLRGYFRQVAGLLVVGSVAGVVMNVAVVLPPVLLGRALNVVLAVQRHHASGGQVVWAAALLVAGTAATEVPRIGKRLWLGVARTRFKANVRADALRGVLGWSPERLGRVPVGDVMARVIGDVEVLGTGVGEVMVETWDTLLFSAALVGTMFAYAPGLAAVALAPVPVALLVAKWAGRLVAARTTDARESAAELTAALHEQLGAARLLRLFGRAVAATGRIRGLAAGQARAELAAIGVDEALAAVYTTLLSAGVVFIVWLGGARVVDGSLSVGGLVAFLALFVRFVSRAPRIPQMANRVQAAGAAYARLAPLLAPPLPVAGEPGWASFRTAHVSGASRRPATAPLPARGGPAAVRFERVSFTYPGADFPAVVGVDVDVPAGALVAVTGPVGSGKSALARLAAGVYAPEAGAVRVGGRPVADLDPSQRAACLGYLAQEPHLFSGSVAENIALAAQPVTGPGSVLVRAAAVAGLTADLAGMPDGFATPIGELGVRVSGGQRQRIALARALAASGRMPGLLVLDDPFSAVDVDTEAAIVAALVAAVGRDAPAGQRATIVLCSHRLAAFPAADVVVVLDAGRIAERGSHTQLLAAGGLYARIFRAQASLGAGPAPGGR